MKRTFTKYPSGYVKASYDSNRYVKSTSYGKGACYIKNYSKYNPPYNVLDYILNLANECLSGSGLSVPNTDAIGISDYGQLIGFYKLYRTASGNYYNISWHDDEDEWKLHIYDELSAQNLYKFYEALEEINDTFNGQNYYDDRPLKGW